MQCELRTDRLTLGRWHIGKWVSPEHAAIESGPDTWDENKKKRKKKAKSDQRQRGLMVKIEIPRDRQTIGYEGLDLKLNPPM